MRCAEFGEVLSEYIEGELDQEETQQVEGHLLRCPACSATIRGVQQVRVALRGLGRQNPPAPTGSTLSIGLQRQASFWSRPLAVGLAVVVGIGVVLWPAPQEVGPEHAAQDWGRDLNQAWYGEPHGEQADPLGQGPPPPPPKSATLPVSAQVVTVSF